MHTTALFSDLHAADWRIARRYKTQAQAEKWLAILYGPVADRWTWDDPEAFAYMVAYDDTDYPKPQDARLAETRWVIVYRHNPESG